MDGNLIDIKRFTLHDGHGIRSTVFLKGCGLHCAWCHNPEGIENRIELWYLPRQCIHCHSCISVCPEKALSVDEGDGQSIVINRQRCTSCGLCVEACPTNALSFDGQRLSSEAVAETLLRDRQFYADSGGGITISGGDPLIQHDFALDILARCKAAGIHTAIETAMQGPWSVLERFLSLTDLFIVDLKLADDQLHREYIGQGNGLIRENYRRLAALHRETTSRAAGGREATGFVRDLLTRIPLIPGVTARPENIQALAAFIRDCNPGGRVELINYNPLAENKYLLMDRDRGFFRNMVPLKAGELDRLNAILTAEGLAVVREHRT